MAKLVVDLFDGGGVRGQVFGMHCPRDGELLDAVGRGRLDVEICSTCGGFFVRLGQESAGQLSKLLERDLLGRKSGCEDALVSPDSGKVMARFVYRGVQLDYCEEAHAVWFDRGEYGQMFKEPARVEKKEAESEGSGFVEGALDVASDASGLFGFVGDFVGDLVSGIDLF